jgi:hypothetical protein
MDINFTLSASSIAYSQTLGLTGLTAGDYTGTAFGVGTRGRNPDTPLTYEVKSFSAIPEPSTLSLLAIAFGAACFLRRRK